MLYMLRIEIDGHHRGGAPIKPWVAEIGKPCPRYGLERTFVEAKNDWRNAHTAWSGNVYGRVATFPLRDGNLYEVAQAMGKSSKRHLVRRFFAIEGGKKVLVEPDDALARADGGGPATVHVIPDGEDTWISLVTALGTPERLGFVTVGSERRYRLRYGVHEIAERGVRYLVGVRNGSVHTLTQKEAWAWLS